MDESLELSNGKDIGILKNLVETFRNDENRRFAFYNLSQILSAREIGILKSENEDYQAFLRGEIPFYSEKKAHGIMHRKYYIDITEEKGYRVKRKFFSINEKAFDVLDFIQDI